jgi:cyclase
VTLTRRVVVCLDVRGDRVVKGVGFRDLRDVGDPVELAERYEREGADEIVFLDVSASVEERATLLDVVRRTAERLFVPLTVGGGVRSADDMAAALRAGADKVSINSAAVARPELLREAAARFGAQAVVASIDAKKGEILRRFAPQDDNSRFAPQDDNRGWEVFTHGGRVATGLHAVEWAERCAKLGAGEILLTSIDRDGTRLGYDLPLTRAVARRVGVPVVASGGAGSARHIVEVLCDGGADAALVAGILHDGVTHVGEIKSAMAAAHIPVREIGEGAHV